MNRITKGKGLLGSLVVKELLEVKKSGVLQLDSGSVFHSLTGNADIESGTLATLSAQNVTPTAAQLIGGYVAHVTVTGGGTFTLPTGANIDTALTALGIKPATGDSFEVLVANTGTQTSTVTTATGLTLVGTAAIPTLKNAVLSFLRTGTATYSVYIVLSA